MKKIKIFFHKTYDIWDVLPVICLHIQFKMINISWLCYTVSIDWGVEEPLDN